MSERLLTPAELSEVLQLSREAVWRYAREGVIPSFRAGRLMRFDLARVLAALEDRGQQEREQ